MRRTQSGARNVGQRRERILEAGFRLFSEKGVDAVSMQSVADASGLSFATLYRYFDSKLSLAVEIGAWKWDEITRDSVAWIRDAGAKDMTGAALFEMYLDRFVRLYVNYRPLLRFNWFFHAYISHERCDPALLKPYMHMIDNVAAHFHVIYERGTADGTLRADIPEKAMLAGTMHIMLAVATRYAEGFIFVPEGTDPERELLQLKDMMLREYRARPDGAARSEKEKKP